MFELKNTLSPIKYLYNALFNYKVSYGLNYFWNFGILSFLFLLIQIISGFFLTFFYEPSIIYAFSSIDFITREVSFGWLIRAIHCSGASFFFLFVYAHIIRGIFYNSFKYPRTLVWISGFFLFILLMASAFLGYVLPWGQMSYWAATVITKLVSVLPILGDWLLSYIWGGYSIGNATLHRFFSLHFLIPFLLLIFSIFHINILHNPGSSNEFMFSGGFNTFFHRGATFFPYYIIKDLFVCSIVLCIFFFFVFFLPDYFNHSDNYNEVNVLITPDHIVPEWYFLPFYGMLRSVLDKTFGVIVVGFFFVSCFFLPLIKSSEPRSLVSSIFIYFFIFFFFF